MSLKSAKLATFVALCVLLVQGCATKPATNSATGPEMVHERFGHAAVTDGKLIYIIGGGGSSISTLTSIEIYDPDSRTTELLTDIITPRRYHSAVFDGKESIYILGGVSIGPNRFRPNYNFEVFNTRTRTVTKLADYKAPTRINTAQFYDGKIFVLGGTYLTRNGIEYSKWLLVYDLKTQAWSRAKDMPTGKETKSVIHGNWLYTVGGYDGKNSLTSVERFNVKRNIWETLPSLPKGISAHSIAVINNKIITFGSYDDLDTSFSYDIKSKVWEKSSIKMQPARHSSATVLDDMIYVIGGTLTGKPPHLKSIQSLKYSL